MKRILLSLCILIGSTNLLSAFAGDTIILKQDLYFTILGIGTKNAQVAIIGNIGPADFKGTQVAGIFNLARGPITGLQAAGVANMAMDSINGVQLGGVFNVAQGNVRGLQAAGAFNVTNGNVYGAQLAGSFNLVNGNVNGAQLAGGANITWGDVQQVQAAGGLNFAKNVKGLQIAGGMNVASGTVQGMQISGGLNFARHVKGVQLGVINFADTVDGAMIGVLSFARHGYHKLEFGWNETMPVNGAFYTGSAKFHNILTAGVDPGGRQLVWGFGYGVGSVVYVKPRFDIDVNVIGHHINKGSFSTSMSELWKLNVLMDFHLLKNISIAAGPSLNLFVTDLFPEYHETPVTGIAPYYFFTQTYSNRWNAKAWVGFNVSARFF